MVAEWWPPAAHDEQKLGQFRFPRAPALSRFYMIPVDSNQPEANTAQKLPLNHVQP